MNYNEYYRNKEYLTRRLVERKAELKTAKKTNENIEQISAYELELKDLYELLHNFNNMLVRMRNKISAEDIDFKNRRIEYLNKIITEILAEFFPYLGLQASISYEDNRNSTKAKLRLKDADGNIRKPLISEGKFCQYLISFAGVAGILQSLGKNSIYLDEAFGVTSRERLTQVGEMLHKSVQKGLFLIAVTQNPELYNSVPRREIRMAYDVIKDAAYVEEVLDY